MTVQFADDVPILARLRYGVEYLESLTSYDIEAAVDEIERLREALWKCLPVMRRAHDRIHCLPRTSDTELAGEIDITLGIVRSALEGKK